MEVEHKEHVPDENSWHQSVKKTLEMIGDDKLKGSNMGQQWLPDTSNFNETALSKVQLLNYWNLEGRKAEISGDFIMPCLSKHFNNSAYGQHL